MEKLALLSLYETVSTCRMSCKEMTRAELDTVILSHLETNRHSFEEGEGRAHVCITYWFHGQRICTQKYLFVHAIGAK